MKKSYLPRFYEIADLTHIEGNTINTAAFVVKLENCNNTFKECNLFLISYLAK